MNNTQAKALVGAVVAPLMQSFGVLAWDALTLYDASVWPDAAPYAPDDSAPVAGIVVRYVDASGRRIDLTWEV